MQMKATSDIAKFLEASPTAFQAEENIANTLREHGFTRLREQDEWRLEPGARCFVERNSTSLVAFALAEKTPLDSLAIAVCHTDSPALKLRLEDASQTEEGLLRIPVEVYGGATIPSWLDRPLKIAGRVAWSDNGAIRGLSVCTEESVAVIPNPPIHFANLNDGFKYNAQTQLCALLPFKTREEFLASLVPDVAPKELHGDLYLADGMPPAIIGDMIQAPRLDNLASCYAILQALVDEDAPSPRSFLAGFFDLEEVGLNYQSAGSNFLNSVVTRIPDALGDKSPQTSHRMLAASHCLSLDAAHAFHPNFPELFDAPMSARLGKGPALKFHANQSYSTTLAEAARVEAIAREKDIPLQKFTPRSDSKCGSTIGRIVAAELGVPAADAGIPIWAMHSIRETASLNDCNSLTRLVKEWGK